MWEQVGVTGAAVWGPAAQAVSLFWAGLWQYLSSQGRRHGVPPPSRSICTPQGGEGRARWGWLAEIQSRKYFQPLPQTPAEPSAWCRGAAAPAQTAPLLVVGLRSDSVGTALLPALGSHARCPSLRATHHPCAGQPRTPHPPRAPWALTAAGAVLATRLLGAQTAPAGPSGTPGTLCRAKGQEGASGRGGRAGATAPSGPSAGAAPLRVPLLAQNPAMKKT